MPVFKPDRQITPASTTLQWQRLHLGYKSLKPRTHEVSIAFGAWSFAEHKQDRASQNT